MGSIPELSVILHHKSLQAGKFLCPSSILTPAETGNQRSGFRGQGSEVGVRLIRSATHTCPNFCQFETVAPTPSEAISSPLTKAI